MKRSQVLGIAIVSALAIAGLSLTFGGLDAAQPIKSSLVKGITAEKALFGGRHHGGWRGGDRGGHILGRICGERRAERIESLVAFVENFVDFTPDQTQAWNNVTEAVRAGSASIDQTCSDLEKEGRPETAPEKLALVETIMATGLDVVQRIRPAFDSFYQTLTEKQRKAIDDLTAKHRRR